MNVRQLLLPGRISCQAPLESKKRVLEEAATLLAIDDSEASAEQLFSAYVARERLGNTAFGHGVAIPHVRSSAVTEVRGALIQLAEPIDFDAEDGTKVDLIFALLAPEHDPTQHLQILAQLAKLLSDTKHREQLRQCQTPEQLLETLDQLTLAPA